MWLLIAILILAALGLLGAVLKAVLLVVGALVLTVVVVGWLGWRSFKKQLAQPTAHQAPPGTTTIIIGDASREEHRDAGELPGCRDDRY